MKKISKKTRILALFIVIVVTVGIIVAFTIGFNFDLRYQEAKKIQLYLKKDFEISDIERITKEALPNQKVILQKVEVFEDTVSIVAKDITEEQKENIINKINEKYNLEIKNDEIAINNIPHTRGRDILKPYILPFMIATIIVLIYLVVRYYKLSVKRILLEAVITFSLVQIILFSSMAIIGIPIGRLTIPLVLMAYLLSMLVITNKFERELRKIEKEEE